MHQKTDITHPIALQALQVSAEPLRLQEKELPPTPVSPRVVALEIENEILKGEIRTLRGELDWAAQQIKRYRDIAAEAKVFSKDVMFGIRHLQDAAFKMKRAERAANKEWANQSGGKEGLSEQSQGTNIGFF